MTKLSEELEYDQKLYSAIYRAIKYLNRSIPYAIKIQEDYKTSLLRIALEVAKETEKSDDTAKLKVTHFLDLADTIVAKAVAKYLKMAPMFMGTLPNSEVTVDVYEYFYRLLLKTSGPIECIIYKENNFVAKLSLSGTVDNISADLGSTLSELDGQWSIAFKMNGKVYGIVHDDSTSGIKSAKVCTLYLIENGKYWTKELGIPEDVNLSRVRRIAGSAQYIFGKDCSEYSEELKSSISEMQYLFIQDTQRRQFRVPKDTDNEPYVYHVATFFKTLNDVPYVADLTKVDIGERVVSYYTYERELEEANPDCDLEFILTDDIEGLINNSTLPTTSVTSEFGRSGYSDRY